MTYSETIDYLYHAAPLFQNIGAGAYKEGLSNTIALDNHYGNPHHSYRTIHIAGTNGKGSSSHTIASILQSAGYKVGLYTSPHLLDFRERIRVNGQMISEQRVIEFVEQERAFFEPLHPSFFELTTALALLYFKEENVDVAVIEVGLGGRMDCTNIITPELSIITNISFDHTQFLGNTLPLIAGEKAGIIKKDVPVVIGESINQEVKEVFLNKHAEVGGNASISFADERNEIEAYELQPNGISYQTRNFGNFRGELGGIYQIKNTATVLEAIKQLRLKDFAISDKNVTDGFAYVVEFTGLMGRWQVIGESPLTVCDTGHNPGGFQYLSEQISSQKAEHKHIVLGMVGDKDVKGTLSLLPKDATYYFTNASVERAMPAQKLQEIAHEVGLNGAHYPSVESAYKEAIKMAQNNDFIYIGGSTFIVSDLMAMLKS